MNVREGPRLGRETGTVTGGPGRQGQRSALPLFAACSAIHLIAAFWVMRAGDPQNGVTPLYVDALLLLVVPGLAVATAMNLPRAARQPFWTTFVLCAIATVVIWGATFVVMVVRILPYGL
jgi:hypothetical protein